MHDKNCGFPCKPVKRLSLKLNTVNDCSRPSSDGILPEAIRILNSRRNRCTPKEFTQNTQRLPLNLLSYASSLTSQLNRPNCDGIGPLHKRSNGPINNTFVLFTPQFIVTTIHCHVHCASSMNWAGRDRQANC